MYSRIFTGIEAQAFQGEEFLVPLHTVVAIEWSPSVNVIMRRGT